MSESDGLQKLTAYLNQTRRQAEAAVDALNEQIEQLRHENELYAQLCKKVEEEKEYFRVLSEQLKQVGTTKQRLQERDDWRSLIDSVQKDRARLQEQCCALESAVESSNQEILDLRAELERLESEQAPSRDSNGQRSANGSPNSRMQRPNMSILCDEEGDGMVSPMLSPILDRNGNEVSINFADTPQNVTRQLRLELKKAHAQLAAERQQSEAERMSHRMEISRLKDELSCAATRPVPPNGHYHSTSAQYVPGASHNGIPSANIVSRTVSTVQAPRGTTTIEWLNPLGYIGYWLGGSSGQSSGNNSGGSSTIIIQV